jgi:hypothetical protein
VPVPLPLPNALDDVDGITAAVELAEVASAFDDAVCAVTAASTGTVAVAFVDEDDDDDDDPPPVVSSAADELEPNVPPLTAAAPANAVVAGADVDVVDADDDAAGEGVPALPDIAANAAPTVAFGIGVAALADVAAVPAPPVPPVERPAPLPVLAPVVLVEPVVDPELVPEYDTWIGRFATLCGLGRSPRTSRVVSRPG